MERLKNIWAWLKSYTIELANEYEQDNVSQLSAALAYYAAFSIVPALIITIAIGGFIFGEQATRERIFVAMSDWMSQDSLDFVRATLERSQASTSSGVWATIISVVLLIVGGTRFFAQLQISLNRVWEVRPTRMAFWEVVRKRLLSFLLIAFMGAVLLASMLVSTVLAAIGKFAEELIPINLQLLELLNTSVTFGVGTVLFGMVFRFFPDVRVKWKDVWLGAALATAALIIAKYGMGLYLGRSAFASAYGAAGSMIVFLFWVYISANIVLMGAQFTQVHARRNGRDIEPVEKAERIWNYKNDAGSESEDQSESESESEAQSQSQSEPGPED